MKDILIEVIKSKIEISFDEEEILLSCFEPVYKSKSEYIVKAGSNAKYLYFIVEGFIRGFYSEKGNEITNQFSTSRELVTSFEAFAYNSISKESIQCISDCSLLRISKANHDKLFQEVANWSVFCKGVYESYILKMSRRANSFQTLSASERYLKFLDSEPKIVQNVSVKHLASYLGIKPQSLSRIRKEIIK
ncbi:MAG: Crp/Fnr family transcriptional regulator [bacterium]|nr:Crp/Fnr family transcriptional regulator [bacterium]